MSDADRPRIGGDVDPRELLVYLDSDAPGEASLAATRLSINLTQWTSMFDGDAPEADAIALALLSHPRGRLSALDMEYWRLSADGFTAILDAGLDLPVNLLRQLWVGGSSAGSAPALAGILEDWSPAGSELTADRLRPFLERLDEPSRVALYAVALDILIDDVCELTELVPLLPDLPASALDFFLTHAPSWPAKLARLLETAQDATAATAL